MPWWNSWRSTAGEVVTRTTLYEHLFDEDENTLSNLLDVHISNLRKKLGADSSPLSRPRLLHRMNFFHSIRWRFNSGTGCCLHSCWPALA